MASNSVLRVLDLLSVCAIRADELAFFNAQCVWLIA